MGGQERREEKPKAQVPSMELCREKPARLDLNGRDVVLQEDLHLSSFRPWLLSAPWPGGLPGRSRDCWAGMGEHMLLAHSSQFLFKGQHNRGLCVEVNKSTNFPLLTTVFPSCFCSLFLFKETFLLQKATCSPCHIASRSLQGPGWRPQH